MIHVQNHVMLRRQVQSSTHFTLNLGEELFVMKIQHLCHEVEGIITNGELL